MIHMDIWRGDELIMNFARLLRNVIPEKHFIGRYGGDEFMAVIYNTSKAEMQGLLACLSKERDRFNSTENQTPIDYACGWSLSVDDRGCTMKRLLDKADAHMYENKQLCKRYQQLV